MIATASARLKAALTGSHHVLARATMYEYLPDTGTYAQVGEPLPVSSGELVLDATSAAWRRFTAKVAIPPAGTPARDVVDRLNVISAEVRVDMGVEFAPGDQEWVQVGQLRAETLDESLSGAELDLVAFDRMIRVSDFPLVTIYAPQDINGNRLTYVEAIKDLVTVCFPSSAPPEFVVDAAIDDEAMPPPETVFEGSRIDAIDTLASALGAVVRNDNLGRFCIVPLVTTADDPAWTFDRSGLLVDATISQTREGQHNAVALTCEPPSGDRIFVYLVDNDPASPTFYDGPFGKKPISLRNDTVTTEAQAIEAARGELSRVKGAARSVRFQAGYCFLLEPMDAVELVLREGESEFHQIDQLSLPFGGGEMSAQTRVFTTTAGG